MIKVKFTHSKNSPPVDREPVEIDTQSKVDGFGKSTPYGLGSPGDSFRATSGEYDPRYATAGLEEDHCEYEDSPEEQQEEYFDIELDEKKDRCYRLAKQKYDVFPSAYASGFIVRCRKGKVAKKKNEELELDEEWSDKYKRSIDCDNPKGFSQRAHCQGRKKNEELEIDLEESLEEGTFDKEKSQGLHGWFARKGGKGKSKGWVDCNTCRTNPKTGRKTCKTCGRQEGEKRSKYPACRPTPSACTRAGTSKKKSSTRVSWKSKKKEE